MKNKILVCPKCGSTDIRIEFENAAKVRLGAPLDRICNSCGYKSTFFLSVDREDVEKIRKEIKKGNK